MSAFRGMYGMFRADLPLFRFSCSHLSVIHRFNRGKRLVTPQLGRYIYST